MPRRRSIIRPPSRRRVQGVAADPLEAADVMAVHLTEISSPIICPILTTASSPPGSLRGWSLNDGTVAAWPFTRLSNTSR